MPHDIFVSADVIREFSVCPKHRSHVTTMFENGVFALKTTSNIFRRRRNLKTQKVQAISDLCLKNI